MSEEELWHRSKREGKEIREGFLEGRYREGQESTKRVKESRLSGQHVLMGPHIDKFSGPGKEG